MREYDEITLKIAGRIFEKGDKILEERRKRSAMIKKLSFSVSGMCAAAITGFTVWNNKDVKNAVHHDEISVITETSVTTANENNIYTTVPQETASVTTIINNKTTTSTSSRSDVQSATSDIKTTSTDSSTVSDVIRTASTKLTSVQTSAVSENKTTTASAAENPVSTHTKSCSEVVSSTGNSAVTTVPTNLTGLSENPSATESSVTSSVIITDPTSSVTVTTTIKNESVTTVAIEESAVETINADFIKSDGIIRRIRYTQSDGKTFILLDENKEKHIVTLEKTDGLNADDVIEIIGDTSFFDDNILSCSGIYQGEITDNVLFFDMEHFSYAVGSETIYSSKIRLYCIKLEDGSKAYAMKIPQSSDYYLYTITKKGERDIYWREAKRPSNS